MKQNAKTSILAVVLIVFSPVIAAAAGVVALFGGIAILHDIWFGD